MTPSSGLMNLLEQLTELKDMHVYQFIKGYDGCRCTAKWRDKSEVWKGLECRSFRPHGTGRQHPPDVDVFINLEVLRTLCYWCFMEVFSNRHDQLLTPFPAPLPSLQKWEWGGAENTKLLTMACFLWTIPMEEPTQRHFGKIKDAPSGCVTYKFTGVRNPVSGTRSKTNIKTGNAPSVLIT